MVFADRLGEFHEQARNATGFDDFGSGHYLAPMRLYLEAIDKGPRLSETGLAVTAGMMVSLLTGRLVTQKGLKQYPQSQDTPIKRPIFIIGLTRSGTTALHRLIACDPNVQHLPYWLAEWPMPRPPRETWESHPAYQRADAAFSAFAATMDQALLDIHPMAADKADECLYLIDQTFCSNRFGATADVPDYQNWWIHSDKCSAYEYYKKALALIANGDSRRWILKDPTHLFCLDAIFAVFPDACVVQTHREPFDAMLSTANLMYLVRQMREPDLTPSETAQQVVGLWSQGLEAMERARRRYNPAQFLDLHMLEVKRDPIGCLERIYDKFDVAIPAETRAAWEREITANPNQSHGRSLFDPRDFCLDKTGVASAVGTYRERYQAVCEAAEIRRDRDEV
ncbi:sulfotransferase family protein [Rhizorhabdus argentea]|uniref:sulfotransferase family protein n=1 Tax=Rhizorhabdus argentea TaxID=1387174 RepID=UPI0030EF7E9C